MKRYLNWLTPLLFTAALFTGCTEKTNSSEKTEINVMDSTAKKVKEASDKLEAQTQKVEESLEKLDKEFERNN